MARQLTTFSKLLITLLILAGVFFGGKFILEKTGMLDSIESNSSTDAKDDNKGLITFGDKDKKSSASGKESSSDEDALDVQIVTWGGFAPGLYFNEGLKHNQYSRFWKEYGLKVNFVLMDDMVASYSAWNAGRLDMRANTMDGMLLEYEGVASEKPEIVLQTDWSRGGDVLVARRGINSINDLKGKKIALTPMTPSQTFLMLALDAAGMKLSDIQIVDSPDNPTAATIFKSGDVDAAVVWSPTHFEIMENVPGAHVIQSTKDASYALAGILYAKQDFINENKDKVQKFYEGWMKASAELQNEANREKAAKIMGETYDLPPDAAIGMMMDAHICNHGDNLRFFGLDKNGGVTGQEVYDNISTLFTKQGIVDSRLPSWRSIINSASASRTNLSGAAHAPEETGNFKAPSQEEKSAPAISTKPISINFPTGVSALSANAKTIIDLEFADVMKTYAGSRIRIEGNTDNVGARDMNMRLSRQRAKAVANYLISEYDVNPNRIITVGNGPDNPVSGCEQNQTEQCKAMNRRTDFQLIGSQ